MSDLEIEQSLRRLLAEHPAAQVAAVEPTGHFAPMPDGVPITTQTELVARTGLELVHASSRQTVFDQFTRAREEGACEAVLTLPDGGSATGYLLDVRPQWGVYVLIWAVHEGGGTSTGSHLPAPEPVIPRYGRMWRNEIAETYRVDTSVCRMFGYSVHELITISAIDFIHPDEHKATLDQWLDIIGSEPGSVRRSRGRRRRSDGTWMWVETTNTNHLDDPDEPHVLSEVVDISEEMANADEVWRGRELLHRLTESLPVGVLQVDSDRGVVYTNQRLHEILGVERRATLDEQVESIVDDERPELDRAVADLLATGVDDDVELRVDVNGGVRYLQVSLRALRDRDEAISGAIACVTDVTDSTHLRKELEHRASYDLLTECLNRATFMRQVERYLGEPRPGVAVVFVDLDGFKAINDRLGHAAGDEILSAVADALRGLVRAHDVLGRLGGDEFVVLCPEVPDRGRAVEIGGRVADALRFAKVIGGETVSIQASVGVAWTSRSDVSADQLVAAADTAMYEAKRAGGHQPVLAGCELLNGGVT